MGPICTECQTEIKDCAYMYAHEVDGQLEFGSSCSHQHVLGANIYLGSIGCIKRWLWKNPDYFERVTEVLFSPVSHEDDSLASKMKRENATIH